MIMLILNKFFLFIKKIIFSVMLIYAYNIIVFPIFISIPMNYFTVGLIMLLGFPAVLGISLFSLFFF